MKTICRIAEINRSSYYAWLKRPISKRANANIQLIDTLKALHKESKETYGAPRLMAKLKAQGYSCSQKRIAHLMKKAGISGCARRKFRPCTTNPDLGQPVSPRIFESQNKETIPQGPNMVWVGDMTYIPTSEGWLYLTTVMDVFNREIVGKHMSDHMREETAWNALKEAILSRPEALKKGGPTLIYHSDRGGQYSSKMYREKLNLLGITQSMSRSGNCYDNAYAETFFHTLKVELVHRQKFQTRIEAQNAIEEYIGNWYNTKRLHSALGYQSPKDYYRESLTE